jgi:hypothetical protein
MLARVLQRNMTNQIMRWIYYLGMKMMLTMCSLVDVLWLPDLFRLILVTQLRKKVALSSEIPGQYLFVLLVYVFSLASEFTVVNLYASGVVMIFNNF